MPLYDLRTFLDRLEAETELKVIHGADTHLEIGAITEMSLQHDGPALLFDQIPNYDANYRVAVNVCSTARRHMMALDIDPNTAEDDAVAQVQKRLESYEPVPPKIVDSGPLLENIRTGDGVDLLQFPVPVWHEADGGAYIGTGHAIIQQDPETGFVNVGTYRGQLHDRQTTGLFHTLKSKDGAVIMRKYWAQGKACPVAISYGPEPLLFLHSISANGLPPDTQEYDYTGFLAGEPVPVIRGNLTGLPISANSEIAIEGEIPPPELETRTEGPFGEWTGYYWGIATQESVIKVKALYFRNDPILFGCPPLRHSAGYAAGLHVPGRFDSLSKLQRMGLPVRRTYSLYPLGPTVISVDQRRPDDVERIMDELEKTRGNNRLIFLVDDDVNIKDMEEVLWAVGTRFDAEKVRINVLPSTWNLDPQMTLEQRVGGAEVPFKRLIINGCRPFHRLEDFPPVNQFSDARRNAVWDKWDMAGWVSRARR